MFLIRTLSNLAVAFVLGLFFCGPTHSQQPVRVPLGAGIGATSELHVLGDKLIFVGTYKHEESLFVTDGTQQGTQLLKRNLGVQIYEGPGAMTVIGQRAYFLAYQPPYSVEPWVSDGTEDGTFMLGDLMPGANGSSAGQFVEYNGAVYFTAYDETYGDELWVTDGTREGTRLAVDIWPGAPSSGPYGLIVFQDALFFAATGSDGITGWWRSDGTPKGTFKTGDMPPLVGVAGLPFIPFRDRLYYVAQDSFERVWTTDGTTAGTYRLSDAQVIGSNLAVCNDALYFGAFNGALEGQLFTSDGTPSGTHEIIASIPRSIKCLGSDIYYWSLSDGGFLNVFRSDGTVRGTMQATDVYQFMPQYLNADFIKYGAQIYFTALAGLNDATTAGYELWALDDSVEGARLVADLNPGAGDSSPAFFETYRGAFYFIASDATGRFLWRITDARPGPLHPARQ